MLLYYHSSLVSLPFIAWIIFKLITFFNNIILVCFFFGIAYSYMYMCDCSIRVTAVLGYLIKNSQAVKKGAAPIKAMVKKDVKSKVAAKKWL